MAGSGLVDCDEDYPAMVRIWLKTSASALISAILVRRPVWGSVRDFRCHYFFEMMFLIARS